MYTPYSPKAFVQEKSGHESYSNFLREGNYLVYWQDAIERRLMNIAANSYQSFLVGRKRENIGDP